MSKKLIWGIVIGAASAITAGVLYNLLKDDEDEMPWDESDGSDVIELASDFLSEARTKARDLVDYANKRSDELLGEANSILLLAKEKAETALEKNDTESRVELEQAKADIEKLVSEYEKKLKK